MAWLPWVPLPALRLRGWSPKSGYRVGSVLKSRYSFATCDQLPIVVCRIDGQPSTTRLDSRSDLCMAVPWIESISVSPLLHAAQGRINLNSAASLSMRGCLYNIFWIFVFSPPEIFELETFCGARSADFRGGLGFSGCRVAFSKNMDSLCSRRIR